jgi:hypothetical protein
MVQQRCNRENRRKGQEQSQGGTLPSTAIRARASWSPPWQPQAKTAFELEFRERRNKTLQTLQT